MLAQRQLVHEGTAIAKVLDYSLKRWVALVRYLDDRMLAIDNNWCDNQIRPWAIGRSSQSELAGHSECCVGNHVLPFSSSKRLSVRLKTKLCAAKSTRSKPRLMIEVIRSQLV